MRKSMIRIATIALAVVMLSTIAITSIIAGYQTEEKTATVTATVSGFGVDVDVATPSGAALNIVPGGSGTLLTVTKSGTPSVAAKLELDATVTFPEACAPIVIKVNGVAVEKGEYATYAAAVEAAIEAKAGTALNDVTVSYDWTNTANANSVPENAQIVITVNAQIVQVEAE